MKKEMRISLKLVTLVAFISNKQIYLQIETWIPRDNTINKEYPNVKAIQNS